MHHLERPDRVPQPGVHPAPWAGEGAVTVAVEAPRAERIDFCLAGIGPEERLPLRFEEGGIFFDLVSGVHIGSRYGLRAHGRWDPENGFFYNPAKLLVDPYARALDRIPVISSSMFPIPVDSTLRSVGDVSADLMDSAGDTPYGVLVGDGFDWQGVKAPRTALRDSVIYEAHVRGMTMRHPDVPAELRGTYAGMASRPVIDHLRALGITAVELLPIQAILDEPHLARQGLTNYWGYNTLSFFAPSARYATAASRQAGPRAVLDEVKLMVRELHRAGIQVISDVVYNHSCEGAESGPMVSLRGLDNHLYYWTRGGSYIDFTGCGNSLNFDHAGVVRLVLDSLRYWASEFRIDGFRFDLAPTLARDASGFRRNHPLLVALGADPVLRDRIMIAEPWDIGAHGWQTGSFPSGVAEWNDTFRDTVRRLVLRPHGENPPLRDAATRLAGSEDIFRRHDPYDLPPGRTLRSPAESIDFVTAHDGFTLYDLTAYDEKHNEANGEGNRDGNGDNASNNHGLEGDLPPDDPRMAEVLPLRLRSMRNLLAFLLLSAGTPMLTAGDEFARTQAGNNNAYCQDNELSWIDWSRRERFDDLVATVARLIEIRRDRQVLRPSGFLGSLREDEPRSDRVGWFDGAARPLVHEEWNDPSTVTLQMLLPDPSGPTGTVIVVHRGADRRVIDLPVLPPDAAPGSPTAPEALVAATAPPSSPESSASPTPESIPESTASATPEAGSESAFPDYRLLWRSDWERPRADTALSSRQLEVEPDSISVISVTRHDRLGA